MRFLYREVVEVWVLLYADIWFYSPIYEDNY